MVSQKVKKLIEQRAEEVAANKLDPLPPIELPTPQQQAEQHSIFKSPKFQKIVDMLEQYPILVEPTLNWLLEKNARMHRAMMNELYTPEQLAELEKQLEEE